MNQDKLCCLLAAFTLFLFTSCKTKQLAIDDAFAPAYAKTKVATPASKPPKGGPQFTGREVRPEFAIPCFKRYVEIMNDHGFVTNPKGKVTLNVNEEMITTSVSYDAEPMMEWMHRMLKAFPDTDPKDIGFLMVPGHLDEQFLKEVGEDPSNWKFKLNRISIFIVAVRKAEGGKIKQLIRNSGPGSSLPAWLQNGPPMWELGGVQP